MQDNPSIDVNNSSLQSEREISALNTYVETTREQRRLERQQSNPSAKAVDKTANQLNKISEQQKRYQRGVPTSMDQLLKLIGLVKGGGTDTQKALRNLILQAATKCEAQVKKIVQEETQKALGCSQEQTYVANSRSAVSNFDTLPINNTIFVPLQSIDLFTLSTGLLKQPENSAVGKVLYEPFPVTTQQGIMRPFGGPVPFPFNKLLSQLQSSPNSFGQQYNTFYKGVSGQDLFDIKYVTTNEYGVTGNYYKIALLNREILTGNTSGNTVGEFIADYYSTIKFFETSELGAQIMNILSQFLNMQVPAPSGPITEQSKLFLILQRILGLCFDQRTEIDVSGVSKIAELDGVDDTFFEFNEVDLRNIDLNVTNVQNGVLEFVDCDNIKVPVDFNNITNQFINFQNTISGQTLEEQVQTLENIINSLSENPDWKVFLGVSFNASAALNNITIKNIALAVASAVLSPKVLLPLFIMLKVTQSQSLLSYNQTVTSASTINTATTNIITNSVDFLKKFKQFIIQVVSRIGEIFLRVLFEELKKELLNLITIVLKQIIEDKRNKDNTRKINLLKIAVDIAAQATRGAFDARKCKSLLDEIRNILNLAKGIEAKPPRKRTKISPALAVLSDFLPGESPQRAYINTIEYLQKIGLPTDALPDGTPNLMLLYNLATHRGRSDEQARNGVNDTYCYQGFCFSIPR